MALKPGEFEKEKFERRQRVQIFDFQTWIITIEDLILSKLASAKGSQSEFDLIDVRNLCRAHFDQTYVEQWVSRLDLAKLWKKCLP